MLFFLSAPWSLQDLCNNYQKRIKKNEQDLRANYTEATIVLRILLWNLRIYDKLIFDLSI